MPSSELSNALNPYINQPRQRSTYPASYGHVETPQPQQYVPHRSELELAISEPPPPPPPTVVVPPRQPTSGSIHVVQELLRMVASTKESQETERKRRFEWEREQELKYAQKQAEMERKLSELTQEVVALRAANATNTNSPNPPASSGLLTPQHMMSPSSAIPQSSQPVSPISPVSQPSSYTYPTFVQGSSNQPLPDPQGYDMGYQPSHHSYMETPAPSATPSPSPHLSHLQPDQHYRNLPVPASYGKKRHSSELSSGDESNGSDSSSSNTRRVRRSNHHDRRCLTIHHAMRSHILHMMQLDNDKQLPDSHTEGVTLSSDDAVRFVWEKTTKQSVHNGRMKERILTDIKKNRKKYKHVPDRDFGKKSLEGAFEACFVTLRQKYKVQQNPDDALKMKQREDNKARRARHASRRKMKLNSRAEARMKVEALQHIIFDGALQLECMSSDDSDDEQGTRSSGMLYTRGHQWRSCRLKRFYTILDDEGDLDKSLMPKRGVGKKERCVGPPKDFALPPERVATWMISKRWIKAAQVKYPDLQQRLARQIEDPPGFEWENFNVLGEESDVDTFRQDDSNYALV